MNVFQPTPSFSASRAFRTALAAALVLLPALLAAQTVTVSSGGIVSIGGVSPIYNGQYVIQKTDFGFLWLDTVALQGGIVQVEAKCGTGQPPSAIGLYVVGDCNGITNVSSSGTSVLARQFSGQCGAATDGCGGPRDADGGTGMFLFKLGSWEYVGRTNTDIADSTQTADLQGRTWKVTANSLSSFTWEATASTTGPPTAAATATNLSAAGRADKTNYYGDKWQLKDTSTTSLPITNIDWDFVYKGSFLRDEGGEPATEGTITGYFPCDPVGTVVGTIRTGQNCMQSLGLANPLTNPTPPASYRLAEQSANSNGTSANVFVSSPVTVVCPQVNIVGYTGFNGVCAKSGGTLNVLTNGSADASGSAGNVGEAAFGWQFTGSNPTSGSSAVFPVPAGATGFTLTITYPGGYQATASGTVVQASLVPAFSLAPNPVLINTPLTLTNQMQIATGTTLNSVYYLINSGACTTPPTAGYSPLATSFNTAGGTAAVTAPAQPLGYCIYVQYNFTPSTGGGQTQVVSSTFTATDSTPVLGIFTDQAATTPPFFGGGAFQLSTGTTYYLKDTEPVAPASAQFFLNSGELPGSPVTGAGPLAWTPTSTCTSSCTVKVVVGGASDSKPVVISSGSPTPNPTPVPTPGPTPPPSGSVAVTVSGPTSGSKGATLTYTATASGGTGGYSYSWACDYNPVFPNFLNNNSPTTTCSYSTSGVHTVKAKVQDSSFTNGYSNDLSVSISGPAPPSAAVDVSGATLNPLNGRYHVPTGTPVVFTASETNVASVGGYSWNFGDGSPTASTRTASHSWTSGGSYAIVLTVRGDEINNSGTSSATINMDITGPPAPSTAYTVAGATQTGTNAYTAEAGQVMTFTAGATQASAFAWDFGDETKSSRSATKSYSTSGARTVRLTVTGDGVNTAGAGVVDIAVNITPPTFRAAIVPGVAHLDDGTTTWGTDVSITNIGAGSMNIALAFVPLADPAPTSLDLTQLGYGPAAVLAPGASYSVRDVVAVLNGGNSKGTLVVQYKNSAQAPLVAARVYFQPKDNPGNISYGSGIPAYEVDGAGRISPLGFVSTVLSQSPGGLGTESEAATLDLTLTVSLTGTGTGTVTSTPAGINCPTTCSATFPVGTVVQLGGSAASGSSFAGLSPCDSYIIGQCVVTMNTNKTVTARFDGGSGPPPTSSFTLSVTKTGTGSGTVSSSPSGITCGGTCLAAFAQGTAVTLTATPDSGSTFSGWGGACSGTGSCVVTLSANASATATFSPISAPAPQGDQILIGLRSDPRYRFVVTLFNASGTSGNFELRATDDQGSQVQIRDSSGDLVAARKFSNLAPFQQVYLRDSDLGLADGRHYVLKATSTKGTLLAFGTALDRKTNDLVQITDDSQASPVENERVSYWVAGVSRIDTYAHWRTDLRVFNRGSRARNLAFQYSYTSDGVTEHVAEVVNLPIAAGQLLTYDDVVGYLLAKDTSVDLSGNSAGILRVSYPADDESASRPLVIGSRNYDDEPTGTAGSQLSVYTLEQAGGPGKQLFIAGAEDSERYGSRIGVFAMDAGPVTGRIVAVGPDGSEVGSVSFTVGGLSPHYGQLSLTDPNLNFRNPGTPVSIRIDQLSGGRVGAYVFTVDKVTLDTNFIQALPQN